MFHHSNLGLPLGIERALNRLLVTPRMHGIHHSRVREENGSNFGILFPWWDALCRTRCLHVPQADIVIGIPGYCAPGDHGLWRGLCLPFRAQRDYWRGPDGRPVRREPPPPGAPGRLAG